VDLDAGVDLDPDLDIDAAADIGDTGNTANVVVPIGAGSKGKVAVDINATESLPRRPALQRETQHGVRGRSIGHGPEPFNLRCVLGYSWVTHRTSDLAHITTVMRHRHTYDPPAR
jgi:hypothetical protein